MKKNLFLMIALIAYGSILKAQEEIYRIGKVTEDELNMQFYDKDSSANAVILFDKGHSLFLYDNTKERFKLIFERQMKIKFFKKEGFKNADIIIPLYKSDHEGDKEELSSVKGTTYNLENGKIVKTKVEKSDVIIEEFSENRDYANFAFPGIKEGSIIELKYVIESYFLFNMQEWRFQYEIPVKHSEYSVLIPEFFNYHKNMRGYDMYPINEDFTTKNEKFLIEYKSLPKAGGVVETGTYELPSISKYYTWTAHDIPAFIAEEYITTEEDYVSILEFEISSVKFPNQMQEDYTKDWNSVNKMLTESEAFGKQLKISDLIQKTADDISEGLIDKTEIAKKIYEYVQKELKWNNKLSKYIDLPSTYTHFGQFSKSYLENIIENKVGNSAEINLLLLMLLKSKQIECHPIIISTRGNGRIYPTHPNLSGYNNVIVEVNIENTRYLLDATSDFLPFGILPEICLNGTGRRVFSGMNEEINIVPSADYGLTSTYILSFNSEMEIVGTVNNVYKGYAALNIREKINAIGGEEAYKNEVIKDQSLKKMDEIKIEGFLNNYDPFKESYSISTEDDITTTGEMIYLTPLLDERMGENPFKLKERKYPVDYSYKQSKKFIMQYQIPEGYDVLEFPENLSISLPEKAGSYQYQVTITGNTLQVLSQFKINQPLIQFDLYPALKEFYNVVIEKQNQKIVFKKKS